MVLWTRLSGCVLRDTHIREQVTSLCTQRHTHSWTGYIAMYSETHTFVNMLHSYVLRGTHIRAHVTSLCTQRHTHSWTGCIAMYSETHIHAQVTSLFTQRHTHIRAQVTSPLPPTSTTLYNLCCNCNNFNWGKTKYVFTEQFSHPYFRIVQHSDDRYVSWESGISNIQDFPLAFDFFKCFIW